MQPQQCRNELSAANAGASVELPDSLSKSALRREPDSHVVLVAADPSNSGRLALQCAEALRVALGLGLRVLHVVPESEIAPASSIELILDQPTWRSSMTEMLSTWAASQAGVPLPDSAILLERGNSLEAILRQAESPDVALVVLNMPPRLPDGGRDWRWHNFLRRCHRPLLLVGPRRGQSATVAATDCADPSLPVIRQADLIAQALHRPLTLVHNIDPVASQYAERVGLPMSSPMADLLAQQAREWLEQAAVESEVVITREEDNANAVLEVARAKHADLLVIGVKPPDDAVHGTADVILDKATQSLLIIPLPPFTPPRFFD